jgi:hypothetical protein
MVEYKMCANEDMAIYILEFIKRNYEKHSDEPGQAGVQKYIEALQMGIDALNMSKEWINVNEQLPKWNTSQNNLPKEEQRVLGFDDECQIGSWVDIYTFRDGCFVDDEGFSYTCSEVTQWHPLPELPRIPKERGGVE